MNKPWEHERCDELFDYYSVYPVAEAAALWCGIPSTEVKRYLEQSTQPDRGIYKHSKVPCLELKCRAMHDAISSGALPVSRENGKIVTEHVAPERRHVSRQNLKDWIAKEFPANKPAFLFDEIERNTHTAINAESFRALQADRDALKAENEKLHFKIRNNQDAYNALEGENRSLKAMVDQTSSLKETERQSLYKLIAAQTYDTYRYNPTDNQSSVPKEISDAITEFLGVELTPETVRKWIKLAAKAYPTRT